MLKQSLHDRNKVHERPMSAEELLLNLWPHISCSCSKSVILSLKNRFNRNSLTHFYVSHFTRWLSLYIRLPGSVVLPRHFIEFDKYLKFCFILLTAELLSVTGKPWLHFILYRREIEMCTYEYEMWLQKAQCPLEMTHKCFHIQTSVCRSIFKDDNVQDIIPEHLCACLVFLFPPKQEALK